MKHFIEKHRETNEPFLMNFHPHLVEYGHYLPSSVEIGMDLVYDQREIIQIVERQLT